MENVESEAKFGIPQCYVVVRKLTLEEITRLSLNPLYVAHKCGRCKERIYYGPQCSACKLFYHPNCAIMMSNNCCEKSIIPLEKSRKRFNCPKCLCSVDFGPQCSVCKAKYHNYCVSHFEQCCQLNLYEREKAPTECAKCTRLVDLGPKCPLCLKVYHVECVGDVLECCRVKFTRDEHNNYKCRKCRRNLGLGCPMCAFCGSVTHGYCLNQSSNYTCCGKRISLELFFIPNFKFVINYYNQFAKRRAALRKMEAAVATHSHKLRSVGKVASRPRAKKKTFKKTVSSQTNALDSSATQTHVFDVLDTITIVDVKTELEQKELDIVDSPPVLEREDLVLTPEPSTSSSVMPDNSVDCEDTLKNLFDFLYNMVKKFPPPLQTQVKIDLFKTVTEAEMKWQCNMVQNNFL